MASITWSNTTPGDDSLASAVDDQIRTDLSAISTGLQQSWYWLDGSAASDGEFKAGTLRFGGIAGNQSPRKASNEEGYLAVWTPAAIYNGVTNETGFEHGGLYHIGKTNPGLVGHGAMIERYPLPTALNARWVVATGTVEVTASDTALMTKTITFGPTYSYKSDVRVFMTIQPSPTCNAGYAANDIFTYGVDYISSTTCQSTISWTANALGPSPGATITVQWLSEGTVEY
jgi:hypothetical protein